MGGKHQKFRQVALNNFPTTTVCHGPYELYQTLLVCCSPSAPNKQHSITCMMHTHSRLTSHPCSVSKLLLLCMGYLFENEQASGARLSFVLVSSTVCCNTNKTQCLDIQQDIFILYVIGSTMNSNF